MAKILENGEAIREYKLPDNLTKFIIKNNFFVEIEDYREEDELDDLPLTSTDTQIITTAFKMAHQLNESRINYDAETVFRVELDKFCQMWDIPLTDEERKSGRIYHNMINSVTRLQKRLFRYPDLEVNKFVQSGYFAYIRYSDNVLEFGFPKPFIAYLKKINEFTWYYLENMIKIANNATSTSLVHYSTVLYETLQMEKNFAVINSDGCKEIIIEAESLKKRMNAPKSCQVNPEFRRKILNKAINHIHDNTELVIKLDTVISGRTVTHYKFICKFPSQDLDFKLAVSKNKREKPLLTAPQRKRFAPLLVENVAFNSIYRKPDEPTKEFIKRIEDSLINTSKVIELWKFLKIVGCTNKKIEDMANGKNKPDDPTEIEIPF